LKLYECNGITVQALTALDEARYKAAGYTEVTDKAGKQKPEKVEKTEKPEAAEKPENETLLQKFGLKKAAGEPEAESEGE
jgi:hypothetical protein